MKVPFIHLKKQNLNLRSEYQFALDKCLSNGNFILGEELNLFEKEFADYIGTKKAIGVSNCHDGLELILKAFDISHGDEVIVPSNTFIATWLAVLNSGAKPVPVEPLIDTFNINPQLIKKAISHKTKAIIVVHLYGAVCEMNIIKEIAKEHNLILIEDAAQSIGSLYNGFKAGSFGDASSFSFYPTKNLGSLGDAGIITTSNEEIAEKISSLRNYGSFDKYKYKYIGRNCRLDEIQAAFLRIKLKKLDKENIMRNKLSLIYFSRLNKLKGDLQLPKIIKLPSFNSWHLFVVLTPKRDQLHQYLCENNIYTLFHYPISPHKQECFQNSEFNKLNLPISEKIHSECISLPISPLHSKEEINYVCDKLEEFFN